MTRRMLINAVHSEECRIAVADDDRLLELEVERSDHAQLKGNIYKAAITRIEPSLQAAFLDIGANRNGFLQINDINPSYFLNWPPLESEQPERERPPIQDVLRPGQELVVQVVKDERSAKGATLTTNLSIPGRYLVLMIGNQRGGVSRKISDEGQRCRLRQVVQKLRLPVGMGVIVRTAGINKGSAELQRDLDSLLVVWYDIVTRSFERGTPKILYQESNLAIRTIRDYLSHEIEEIIIDEKETFERAREFIEKVVPRFMDRVKFFPGPQPLFSTYHLDNQIEETGHTEVTLPSGGSIVINITEAVVAIDVNSGRATSQADVEETAFETNKEAADVIAQQLRLRDLGGLIVIDFIDMIDRRHKLVVEKAMRDAVRSDKAKVEIGRISKFGLLEMSRQRLKSSLVSQSHTVCPHCEGRGRVKAVETAALEALRKIQSAVFAGGVEEVRVRMAPAAALLLLNNKRQILVDYERLSNTSILVYADGRIRPGDYELEVITNRTSGEHPGKIIPQQVRETNNAPRTPQTRNSDNRKQDGSREKQDSRRSQSGRNRGRGRSRDNRNSRGQRERGHAQDNYRDARPKADSPVSDTAPQQQGPEAEPQDSSAPNRDAPTT